MSLGSERVSHSGRWREREIERILDTVCDEHSFVQIDRPTTVYTFNKTTKPFHKKASGPALGKYSSPLLTPGLPIPDMPTFNYLPPEIKGQITSHLESTKDLSSFSRTCKDIRDYLEEDGYRIFVQSNFPSIRTPPRWREAAHALTTLTKSWDQRSFAARYVDYSQTSDLINIPKERTKFKTPFQRQHGRIPGSQSMGCQPVLDCAQEWTGSSWKSQQEVLAMGMGAELKIRIRNMGASTIEDYQQSAAKERLHKFNHLGHREQWVSWRSPGYWDGRDDITSLSILRHISNDPSTDPTFHLVVGRASGSLERVAVNPATGSVKVSGYETTQRPVRSAHVSPSDKPLLSACLSDGAIAVYDVNAVSDINQPLSETPLPDQSQTEEAGINGSKESRTWTNRWLTTNRLVVGSGPSRLPISIYEVADSGLSPNPVWKLTVDGLDQSASEYDGSGRKSSVYSIMPLCSTSPAGSADNGQFLSGWFSGLVKLHDMRTRCSSVQDFIDPIDPNTAVYSILPFGSERFVAGVARHSMIKIFDLRMPGEKRYSASRLAKPEKSNSRQISGTGDFDQDGHPPNFNIYLAKHPSGGWRSSNPIPRRGNRMYTLSRQAESPVYSLTAATSFSPVFYAGLEDRVMEIQLVSGLDRTPDAMYTPKADLTALPRGSEPYCWLDSDEQTLSLGAVNHNSSGQFVLKNQGPVGLTSAVNDETAHSKYWDYRWGDR